MAGQKTLAVEGQYSRTARLLQRSGKREALEESQSRHRYREGLALLLGVLRLLPLLLFAIEFVQTWQSSFWAWVWAMPVALYRLSILIKSFLDVSWRLCRGSEPPRRIAPCPLMDAEPPLIDVIITTCGEDPDMIMDTVRAACELQYPRNKFRVVVADDGDDAKLRFRVKALGQSRKGFNLFYHAREKDTPVEINPKACNVNNALLWIQHHGRPTGKSEWFVVLDCDMMPEPQFLTLLLNEAKKDPGTAMVVCPQNYYNIPVNDPLYQSMEVQNTLDEPARNSIGATWCAGSGFLARRTAIDSIGGIPTESVCEDILCGVLLNGNGWRVAYLDLPLQWGLMPDSIESHIAQRRRWLVGSVQNGKITKFCFGSKASRMSIAQRLAGCAYCFAPYAQYVLQPLELVFLPWCFIFGPLNENSKSVCWMLFWVFFDHAVTHIKTLVETTWASHHTLLQREYSQYWLRCVIAPSVIAEVLPQSLGPYHRKSVLFVSSGSIQSSMDERSSRFRVPLRQRLWTILFDRKYLINTFMLINAIVSLSALIWVDVSQIRSGSPVWMTLISHSLSPALFWERQMSFAIPILYAALPPSVPEQRKMMRPDRTGAWRVKADYKKPQIDRWAFVLEVQAWFSLVWSAVVFLSVTVVPKGSRKCQGSHTIRICTY